MHQCDMIITKDDALEDVIHKIDRYLLDFHMPSVFDIRNKNNVLNVYDMNFENLCTSMESNGSNGIKNCNTFEFYAKIRYYKNRVKEMEKQKK